MNVEQEGVEDRNPWDDPDWCPRCQGEGRVTTADYESYSGEDYKPCPECHGWLPPG